MLTPVLGDPADVERYDAFISDLIELIVEKYDGSLKAEHGTGRNMAPFVEREWGAKATEMMWRVKELADPDGVLNPGVVLNRDPGVHLRTCKTTPPIEEEATACVECGFCEPVCPSRWLTTTPRQRIVLRREMARQPAGSPVAAALLGEYEYDALQTCAADGTLPARLPGRDRHRQARQGASARASTPARGEASRCEWPSAGRRSSAARAPACARARAPATGARPGPTAARALVERRAGARAGRANMPPPAPARCRATAREGAAAVYLPACINRIFGRRGRRRRSLPEALVARFGARRACRSGSRTTSPATAARRRAARRATRGAEEAWRDHTRRGDERWTDGGKLPVVIDANSCTQGLATRRSAQVIDAIEWAQRRCCRDSKRERTRLRRWPSTRPASVAATCGLLHPARGAHGRRLADEVVVPAAATCCGFAGDRGMLHPELTAAATADEAAELAGRAFDAHVCGNRTCEIGLSRGDGRAVRLVRATCWIS